MRIFDMGKNGFHILVQNHVSIIVNLIIPT